MKTIHIDFAPRSIQRAVMLTPIASWIVAMIALSIWTGIAIKVVKLTHQKDTTEVVLNKVLNDVQTLSEAKSSQSLAAKKVNLSETQATAVNSTIAQLNLPWRDLFDAIESATPATIALLSIEPDAKRHRIKVMAEARTADAMITYIEQLKKEELFSSVLLTKHEINEQDPNNPIRFQLEALWIEMPL